MEFVFSLLFLWNLQCGPLTGTGRKCSALFFPLPFILSSLFTLLTGFDFPRGVDDDDGVDVVVVVGNYGGERGPKKKICSFSFKFEEIKKKRRFRTETRLILLVSSLLQAAEPDNGATAVDP